MFQLRTGQADDPSMTLLYEAADPISPAPATVPVSACPVCGARPEGPSIVVHDRWFGAPGQWRVRRCGECASRWLDPRPHDDELAQYYENYYTHGDTGSSRRVLSRLMRALPWHADDRAASMAHLARVRPGRVLDIGCGDGRTLRALTNAGWTAVGLDTDAAAVAAATAAGLDARVGTIDSASDALGGPFDAIVAQHVIEHVPEPARLLSSARRHLRAGGRLVLVTPNALSRGTVAFGPAWRGWEPPRHLQIFSPSGLARLVTLAGFTSVRSRVTPRGTAWMWRASHASPLVAERAQMIAWQRRRVDPWAAEELIVSAVAP